MRLKPAKKGKGERNIRKKREYEIKAIQERELKRRRKKNKSDIGSIVLQQRRSRSPRQIGMKEKSGPQSTDGVLGAEKD